jgi:hypothetical protein
MTELTLFILKGSMISDKAVRNLQAMMKDLPELSKTMTLKIIDINEDMEAAETANLLATPALIAKGKINKSIVGDLSDREQLMYTLGISIASETPKTVESKVWIQRTIGPSPNISGSPYKRENKVVRDIQTEKRKRR